MATYTTLAAATAAYLANADYADAAGDVAKARAFRSACIALQILRPTGASGEGHSASFDASALATALASVKTWLNCFDTEQADPFQVQIADARFTQ